MPSLIYPLNIGTLATWLSVAGFGTVGVVITEGPPSLERAGKVVETIWQEPEITIGSDQASSAAADSPPADIITETREVLPDPPAMPETAALSPLPEIPEIPAAAPPVAAPRPAASLAPASRPARPAAPRSVSHHSAGSTGTGAVGSPASGLSTAARLAGGRMPAPSYPAEARRLGQTGTLVVEFTIDTTGQVISAYAKSPSPWPLLNEEAVRTVRRWKFPPGPVMKLQRPIVFQLR